MLKKKRLITFIMVVAFMLSFMPLTANATVDASNPEGWQWYKYNNSRENNAITNAPTVINPKETKIEWAYNAGSGWENSITPPIISDGFAYVGSGNRIIEIDLKSGQETQKSKDAAALYDSNIKISSYKTRSPLFAEGKIFIQCDDGKLMAVDHKTLKPLWVTESVGNLQTIANLSYAKIDNVGYVYLGTFQEGESGKLFCVALDGKDLSGSGNIKTKKTKWIFEPEKDKEFSKNISDKASAGFYWSGAYVSDKYLVIPASIGKNISRNISALFVLNPKTGKKIDANYETKGGISSSITYDEGNLYFTSNGYFEDPSAKFYKIAISNDGKLGLLNLLKLDENKSVSTSTPTVYKGRAYVGVGKDLNSPGKISVIDTKNMEEIYSVPTPGYPQESVLLTTAYENQKFSNEPDGIDRVYLYFSVNKNPGTIYSFYDTPRTIKNPVKNLEDLEFVKLNPIYNQYNISPVAADKQGNLYFKNDSANLFKVTSSKSYLENMKLEAVDGKITMDTGSELNGKFDSRVVTYTGKHENTTKAKLTLKPVQGATATVNGKEYKNEPMEVEVNKDGNTSIEVVVTKEGSKRIYTINLRPKGVSADLKAVFVSYGDNRAPWISNKIVEIDKKFNSQTTEYSTIYNDALKQAKAGNIWFVADDPNATIKVEPIENWDANRLNSEKNIPLESSMSMYQGGATFYSKLYPENWDRDAKFKIVVTSENGKNTNEYKFTISNQIYVSNVNLNKTELTLDVNGTYKLTETISPSNATDKSVKWSSNKNDVVYVDQKGNIKALKPGTAEIIVTTNDKGKTAKCVVTVPDKTKENLEKTIVSATKEIENYADLNKYREAQAKQVQTIVSKAKDDISKAKSQAGVESILKLAKSEIDKIPTDEGLKETAKAEAKSFEELVDDIEKPAKLESLSKINKAKNAFEKLSDEAKSFVSKEKEEQLALREKEYDKAVLDADFNEYKDVLVKELEKTVDLDLYREAEKTEIKDIFDKLKQAMDKASDKPGAKDLFDKAKEEIDKVKTDKALTEVEIPTAIKEIKDYKNLKDYREDQKTEITRIIESAEKEISKAESVKMLERVVADTKTKLDAVKTDAQLSAAEEMAKILDLTIPSSNKQNIKTEIENGMPKYIKGVSEGIEIELGNASVHVPDLLGVYVDNAKLGNDKYDAREGSIIISLHKDYLDTLSPGTHVVKVESKKGTGTQSILIAVNPKDDKVPGKESNKEVDDKKIDSKEQNTTPDSKENIDSHQKANNDSKSATKQPVNTGDSAPIYIYGILAVLGISMLLITMKKAKK